MKEIGIYVHIPFCSKKCGYCDFLSFEKTNNCVVKKYIDNLVKEISERSDSKYIVKTIYIGGGTPSYIDSKYIYIIIQTIYKNYQVDDNVEITIEVNPGTVTKQKLEDYKNAKINRISVGLQIANNKLLKEIGRIHTYKEYEDTIFQLKEMKFKNISTDIIIGLPNQTIEDIEETLNKILKLDLQHISIYSLIVEENTDIYDKLKSNKITLPDEEIERYMYFFAKKKLEENGYIHYEISNFAKQGYFSKHNLDCWNQKEYLGIGIGAASYLDNKRFRNIQDINKYINNIKNGKIQENYCIEEVQKLEDKMKEYILLKFRTLEGFNINQFIKKFKKNPIIIFKKHIENFLENDWIEIDKKDNIKLTRNGLNFLDIIWKEILWEED